MNNEDPNMVNVIQDGIRFMESLVKCYGQDKGMEVWNALGAAMGKEVQGKVLFAMLTGSTSSRIKFRAGDARVRGNTVAVIKCIRNYAGYGLKGAKDLWDLSDTQIATIEVDSGVNSAEFARALRDLGCHIL